jgi:acyl-coenzyme A synthetase/AMP-(fatty) acid ligase
MPTVLMTDLIRTRMRQCPDEAALYQGKAWLTHGELADLVDAMGTSLRRSAALPEYGTVTIPAVKSAEGIALLIACWTAGYQTLLVSPVSGDAAIQELSERAGSVATVTTSAGEGRELVVVPHHPDAAKRPDYPPAEPAIFFTTSGSTGTPKIVACSSEGIDAFSTWADSRFGLGAGRVVLSYAPLNFDISLLDVWAPLASGGRVVLVDPYQATVGDHLTELVRQTHCAVIQAVPMFFDLFTDAADGGEFPAVSEVILTGDATPPHILRRLPEVFPAAAITNVYGCTETNDSLLHAVDPRAVASGEPLPLGVPIDGVRALILDDSEAVVSGAGEGELLVSTPFQAHGYLDPAATAVKWVTMPDGVRYFRTGDLVRRDAAGITYLLGRKDSRIKVRGVTTDTSEVEHVISAHPDVAEAAVVGVPSPEAGYELHAVIRPRAGAQVTGLVIRRHCAARLPLTSIPTRIDLVDRLPRTITGKLDRALVVRQRLQSPDSVKSEVRDFIVRNFAGDIAHSDLTDDLDLMDVAVINSLQVLRLIAWIGDHYNIPLKEVEISPQNFRTVGSIVDFIQTASNARR